MTFSHLGTKRNNSTLKLKLTVTGLYRPGGRLKEEWLNINLERSVPSGLALIIPILPNHGTPENWMQYSI